MSDELMLKLLVFGSMAVMLLIPTVICFVLCIRCITKKNRCTIPVRAKCIDIESAKFNRKHPDGGWSRNVHTSYCPVFTATINNKEITYTVKNITDAVKADIEANPSKYIKYTIKD